MQEIAIQAYGTETISYLTPKFKKNINTFQERELWNIFDFVFA